MDHRLLHYLIDPNDGGALHLETFEGRGSQTRSGALISRQTGRWFPIRDGIPSVFVDDLREGDEAFVARHRDGLEAAGAAVSVPATTGTAGDLARIEAERKARDEQAEDYDRMLSLKVYECIETPAYRAAIGEENRAPLLEAGCGTGRFTGLFAELASEVVAVDMSRRSILRNRVRHAGRTMAPVHYLHADLTHLPLRDGAFGRTAHCGVYEHIPSRELRQEFLRHARRTLQPDGKLLLAAYRYGGVTRLFGKEGEHAGGIPFTRFTEAELREELQPYFQIESFRPNLGIYMSMLVAKPLL